MIALILSFQREKFGDFKNIPKNLFIFAFCAGFLGDIALAYIIAQGLKKLM